MIDIDDAIKEAERRGLRDGMKERDRLRAERDALNALLDRAVAALQECRERDQCDTQNGCIIDGFTGEIAREALAEIRQARGKDE